MFHPLSDLCGESIQNVQGNLGEASNIDVIRLTKVNQGLRSGENEIAQGDVIRLKCLGLSILQYLRFKEPHFFNQEEHIFSTCAKFLEVCDTIVYSSAAKRPHPAIQELLVLSILELIQSQILMIWQLDQKYIVANGKNGKTLGFRFSQWIDYVKSSPPFHHRSRGRVGHRKLLIWSS